MLIFLGNRILQFEYLHTFSILCFKKLFVLNYNKIVVYHLENNIDSFSLTNFAQIFINSIFYACRFFKNSITLFCFRGAIA